MEKSAVDFLVKELNEKAIVGGTIDRFVMNNAIEQAKEMEKQQQGYSEEEVLEILLNFRGENPRYIEEWFEQFKKK